MFFPPTRDRRANANKAMPHIKSCSLSKAGGIIVLQQPLPQDGHGKISLAIPSVSLTHTVCVCVCVHLQY